MNAVQIKGYRATDFEFHGHLEPGKKITLDNKFTYNVRYKDRLCVSTLECSVFSKEEPEKFSVKIVIEGVFAFEEGYTREQLHVATYKELFPYARSITAAATALYGIPPVMLPQVDIENQSIYRIDTGNLKP